MFKGGTGFKSVKKYTKWGGRAEFIRRLKNGRNRNLDFEVHVFVDIMMAEYHLREIVQREQCLKNKARALEKIANKHEARYEEELARLLQEYSKAEWDLYLKELKLPVGFVKRSYDILRQNPTWYLREELVEDCARRGGCCGRNCGCCKTHQSATRRAKGIGHCTPSCGCCSNERGFEYTAYERQKMATDLRKALNDNNPAYLVKMAEGYFLKPRGGILQWN